MDFFKYSHGFVKVVLCISRPLPNKTKLKFDQDLKACWSFCFELNVLNDSRYSIPWINCAFGNVYTSVILRRNFKIHSGAIWYTYNLKRHFWNPIWRINLQKQPMWICIRSNRRSQKTLATHKGEKLHKYATNILMAFYKSIHNQNL